MADETCSNCRFFRLNPALAVGAGACRRRPPVWTGPDEVNAEGMFAFPRVSQDNWCGEWESRSLPKRGTHTLTDAERSDITIAADAYADNDDDPDCERIAATLRRLLDPTRAT